MNKYLHYSLLALVIPISILMHEAGHGVIAKNHGCVNVKYELGAGIRSYCEEYRQREPWEEQQEAFLQSVMEIVYYHLFAFMLLFMLFIQTYREKVYI